MMSCWQTRPQPNHPGQGRPATNEGKKMAVSAAVQAALNSKPRAAVYCDSEIEAQHEANVMRDAGRGNVRVSKYLDHKRQDGTKVYKWIARCNEVAA